MTHINGSFGSPFSETNSSFVVDSIIRPVGLRKKEHGQKARKKTFFSNRFSPRSEITSKIVPFRHQFSRFFKGYAVSPVRPHIEFKEIKNLLLHPICIMQIMRSTFGRIEFYLHTN